MKIATISQDEFFGKYNRVEAPDALSYYTPLLDVAVILALLKHSEAKTILEIGTAHGHTTANLTKD